MVLSLYEAIADVTEGGRWAASVGCKCLVDWSVEFCPKAVVYMALPEGEGRV